MAISATGAMFKAFEFDGVSSRNYGVYITGEAVYNAPERAVEMITIPNRNGAFAQDQGRFENIEVTYPAGIFADNESDFADGISNLRNLLCSKRGYCRLEDDYNPNEYRLAIYKSGLEVEPALLKAGEFEITFECMPQRFLKSGGNEITVINADSILNPSRFASHPLFEVWGSGSFGIDGKQLTVNQEPYGHVQVTDTEATSSTLIHETLRDLIANGDTITAPQAMIRFILNNPNPSGYWSGRDDVITDDSDVFVFRSITTNQFEFIMRFMNKTFTFGTPGSYSLNAKIKWQLPDMTIKSMTYDIELSYDGSDGILFEITTGTMPTGWSITNRQMELTAMYADSTKYPTGDPPIYFDLDIGEAYTLDGLRPVSANNAVTMPMELPVFGPGSHRVYKDNTITTLKMVPRWWKI